MTVSQSNKNMTLGPGVVDTIISLTASQQPGVAAIGNPAGGFFAKLANRPSTSGIETSFDEDGKLKITMHIDVYYGYALPELADNIRSAIADALKVQVGVDVSSIDIFIDGVQFDEN